MEGVFNDGAQVLVDKGSPRVLSSVVSCRYDARVSAEIKDAAYWECGSGSNTVVFVAPQRQTTRAATRVEGRSTNLKQTFIGCITSSSMVCADLGSREKVFNLGCSLFWDNDVVL